MHQLVFLLTLPLYLSANTIDYNVNGDSEVTIADIDQVTDIILNSSQTSGNHQGNCVDLGLPSGTLWATMNIGATNPKDYGDYFAWGETEPKNVYNWYTYKWCNGSNNKALTKYCSDSSYGIVDYKTELERVDDVAYVNWGPSWCMPTKEQQDELREKYRWTRTMRNSVNGYLVIGPNGSSMFLPAGGNHNEDKP